MPAPRLERPRIASSALRPRQPSAWPEFERARLCVSSDSTRAVIRPAGPGPIEAVIDGLDILGPSIAAGDRRGRTGLLEGELRIGHTTSGIASRLREPKAFILLAPGEISPQLPQLTEPRLNVFRFRRRFQGL